MTREDKPDFIQTALTRWRWIRWKLFLVWAVAVIIALVFVVLPLFWSAPPGQ